MNSNLKLQVQKIDDTTKFALETADEIRVQGLITTLDELTNVPHVSTEENLQVLMKWEEILKLATDAFNNERSSFNRKLLEKFEEAVQKLMRLELFCDVHNSTVAIANMLTFLHELRATRAGLCGVIHNVALPEVRSYIKQLTEQLEKERELDAIMTELSGWSLKRIRAFRTAISEDSPE